MAKKNQRTILITGATGRQGGAVARHLQARGFPVRLLTRDPAQSAARGLVGHGAEVVRGDLNVPGSLRGPLEDVFGVFGVQTPIEEGVGAESAQGTNLVDAARRANVSHFVFSSVVAADRKTGIPHFESKFKIEEHLRGSGLRYTVLRPAFFMENWLDMRDEIEGGRLALPLSPDTRLQMVAVDDIGGCSAAIFDKPGRWLGRAIELAGDELSMKELAAAFSNMVGRTVEYVQTPWQEVEQQAGHAHTMMYRWLESDGSHVDLGGLRQEFPHMTSFERWLQTSWRVRHRAAG